MTDTDGSVTLGVLGVLGLDATSASEILPHEETLAKAKSDRLELLTATRVNLSPIWGLSLAAGLTAHLATDTPPAAAAVDDDGVRHELWVVDDPTVLASIAGVVGSAPVVVADGHHRLATAKTYLEGAGAGTPGADGVLALVVELAEDTLSVGPIHRLLSGLPDGLDLVDAFDSWFDVARAGECTERTTAALGESSALALVMSSGCWLLTPRDGTAEAAGSDLLSSMVALVHRRAAHPRAGLRQQLAGRRGRRRVRGRPGRRPAPPGGRRPDRRLGPRPEADAPEEHVLPPEAPDRHGLPVPRPGCPHGLNGLDRTVPARARGGTPPRRPRPEDTPAVPLAWRVGSGRSHSEGWWHEDDEWHRARDRPCAWRRSWWRPR